MSLSVSCGWHRPLAGTLSSERKAHMVFFKLADFVCAVTCASAHSGSPLPRLIFWTPEHRACPYPHLFSLTELPSLRPASSFPLFFTLLYVIHTYKCLFSFYLKASYSFIVSPHYTHAFHFPLSLLTLLYRIKAICPKHSHLA